MSQYLEGNRFEEIGESIRLPDDVTVGFIVEHKLGVPLTPIKLFHSHLEPLKLIPKHQLHQQVSLEERSLSAGLFLQSLCLQDILQLLRDWQSSRLEHCGGVWSRFA